MNRLFTTLIRFIILFFAPLTGFCQSNAILQLRMGVCQLTGQGVAMGTRLYVLSEHTR